MRIELVIAGDPAPQGSKRHVGNGVMVEMSKKVKPWRKAIIEAVNEAGYYGLMLDGPLSVEMTFWFSRPMTHFRTGKFHAELRANAPVFKHTPPDVDKLVRSTFDGLTQSGIVHDDARFVKSSEEKRYTNDAFTGALIIISTIE